MRSYSKASTFIAETLGVLLSALLAFASVLLLERLLTRYSGWYGYTAHCWPLLLCYVCGRAAARRGGGRLRALLRFGSLAAAMAIVFLLTKRQALVEYILWALTAIPALLLFYIGTVCVPVYPQSFAIGSVFLHLFEIFFFAFAFDYGGALTPLNICAVAAFLLYLYSANVKSLYIGLHAADGKTGLPAGIRWRNTLLLGGFTAAALLVAATGVIQKTLGLVFGFIAWLYALIRDWLNSLGGEQIDIQMPESEPVERVIEEGEPLNWFVIAIVVVTVLAVLILMIMSLIKYGGGQKRPKRQRKKRRLFVESSADDEEESVFDWDAFLGRGKDGLRGFAERFKRKPGFDDMPDGASKLRFAYKQLLRSPGAGKGAAVLTPLELGKALSAPASAQLSRMAGDYSAVRYGEAPPSDAAVENARRSLRELHELEKAHT